MILQQYKIVFSGSMGAGKTEAIRSLSDVPVLLTEAFNTDLEQHEKMETTVGIDYGEVTLDDGTKIGLYGTPGQERFNFIWPVICQGAIGAIVLIDHNNENPIEELESYLEVFQNYTDNIAIGVTHTDLAPDNSSTNIYKDWLISQDLYIPLFFIDARKKEDALLLLEALITSLEVNHNITA